MKKIIIKIFKKNKFLFKLIEILFILYKTSFIKISGGSKKYPKVIQLPITYRCNSRCIMCNVWKMDSENEISLKDFSKILKDPIFKKVESVGINGGEPSVVNDLHERAEEILKLPKIKKLNIISNGFSKDALLKKLEVIYNSCKKRGVYFHVSISLDGVGKIHDSIRNVPNAFEKVTSTIDEILKNKHLYCDSYTIACTVVKQNVNFLAELDTYSQLKGYNIKYRLGIENKRIGNNNIKNQYSVVNNKYEQSAKEFFHYKMIKSKNIHDKFKYFSIFNWLNNENPKRLLGCMWKDEGITLDSRGKIYYCAVASNVIGDLKKERGRDVFFSKKNIEHRKSIIKNKCDLCIHDYSGKIELKNFLVFFKFLFFENLNMRIYKIKSRFL